MSTLLLSLGGTGGLVARRLKCLLSPEAAAGLEILAIDQDRQWTTAGAPFDLGMIEQHELLPLSGETARILLHHASGWRPYLDWLPQRADPLPVDELTPEGAGGQRWLGRLAFFAHDQLARDAVRSRIAALSRRAGEITSVLLVSSLDGGTGSGLLGDITYLAASLAPAASRLAYLLLPTEERCSGGLEHANAYAALQEVYLLKARKLPFRASYPMIGTLDAGRAAAEPWSHVFLFGARQAVAQPYFDAIDRIAQALAIQLRPAAQQLLVERHKRHLEIRFAGDQPAGEAESCFSACVAARDSVTAGSSQGGGIPDAAPVAEKFDAPVPSPSGPPGPLAYAPGDGRRDPVGAPRRAALEAADLLIAAVQTRCHEVVERGTHEHSLVGSEDDLRKIERAVAAVVDVELPPPGITGFWRRLLWRFHLHAPPSPATPQAAGLADLPDFARAEQILQDTVSGPLPTGPGTERPEAPGAPWEDRRRAMLQVAEPGEPASLSDLLQDWTQMLREDARQILRLHPLERRCAALTGIVQHAAFRRVLRERLLALAGGQPDASTECAPETPVAAPAGGTAAVEQADASAGASTTTSTPGAVGNDWRARIDALVAGLDRSLFVPTCASPRKRAVPIALLPAAMCRQVGEQALGDALSDALRSALVGPLCGGCGVVPVPEDEISLLVWELNHSPCELRTYAALRVSYLEQPAKERFHLDPRFLAAAASDPCERPAGPPWSGCGNPGCDMNIAGTPPEVRCCPRCCRPIRSRCGNPNCPAVDLHLHADGRERSCPRCNGFNHAAWWLCHEHGKVPVWISIDKRSCPECIRRYQEDEERSPLETVSWRPHDHDCRRCPNCLRLAESDPQRTVFTLPRELIRFYDDGVNGHDRAVLAAVAARCKMPEDARCPECRTPLIPADEGCDGCHDATSGGGGTV